MKVQDLPILVTGFNRPHLLENVLFRLSRLGMKNIWLCLDGPRAHVQRDIESYKKNKLLLSKYSSLFGSRVLEQPLNVGCKLNMNMGISWFFENNDYGVIIEDDIIFSDSLFEYQLENLKRFEADFSVGSITGFMPVDLQFTTFGSDSRFLVSHKYFCAWGWGSWATRWREYQADIPDWQSELSILSLIERVGVKNLRYWIRRLNQMQSGQVDTWDFQFLFLHFKRKWSVIAPSINLIGNVGFGELATHTKKSRKIPELGDFPTPESPLRLFSADRQFERDYLRIQFGV